MKHGTYVGPDSKLKGEKALVREDPESKTRGVLAQFDNLDLPKELTHGWASFYAHDFELDKTTLTEEEKL